MSFAYISSEARIFFAFTNICFSPVERPFSRSRRARFRTTSASSRMSPVFILSRLCLKRRFQFFGISVETPVSALRTPPISFSPITRRRPTLSAFSDGTCTVMSLCRILIVRYSRCSSENLALLLLDDRSRPVVGIDHLVADSRTNPNLPWLEATLFAKKAGTPLCAGHRLRV